MARAPHGRPLPTGRERPFALHELFFSTTDRKGIIRSGNEVFTRVSAYEHDELIGSPHNVIRHPDMPRAVFQTLWDTIQAGRPIAAYVKNLAKDGGHYWVVAVVVPVAEGYLSVRLKPSTPFLGVVEGVYAELREVEERVEAGDSANRKAAIAASCARLEELVTERGFASYAAFMDAFLPAELRSREAALAPREARGRDHDGDRVGLVLAGVGVIDEHLARVVLDLERYAALQETLVAKSQFVHGLADEIRIFSLNALLGATRLGDEGVTLGAVAALMRRRSAETGPIVERLAAEVAGALDLLGDLGFRVAVAKLQTEMTAVFAEELLASGTTGDEVRHDLATLLASLEEGADRLFSSLAALDERLKRIAADTTALRGALGVMRALEVNGRIEAARASGGDAVLTLFRAVGEQVGAAQGELGDLVLDRSDTATRHAHARIRAELETMRAQLAA
jgi:aerotaxis receptor